MSFETTIFVHACYTSLLCSILALMSLLLNSLKLQEWYLDLGAKSRDLHG